MVTLSPRPRHDRPRLGVEHQQIQVRFPMCRNDECAQLLPFQSLEQALRDALKSVLEKDGHSNPRTRFYNRFKAEVAEHDDDFLQTYNADLDTTLIFVCFFSPLIEPNT